VRLPPTSTAFTLLLGFLVALDNDLFRFDPTDCSLDKFAEVETNRPTMRLNDGRCDRQGRFWVGTMDNELSQPLGGLYRVDPSGVVTKADEGVIVSNSVATSPDGKTLYFSDTRKCSGRSLSMSIAGIFPTDACSSIIPRTRAARMARASTPMDACGTRSSLGVGSFVILRPKKLIDRSSCRLPIQRVFVAVDRTIRRFA
jgi:SMP-30/Gluconolactonase/LRE-like region